MIKLTSRNIFSFFLYVPLVKKRSDESLFYVLRREQEDIFIHFLKILIVWKHPKEKKTKKIIINGSKLESLPLSVIQKLWEVRRLHRKAQSFHLGPKTSIVTYNTNWCLEYEADRHKCEACLIYVQLILKVILALSKF